MHVKIFEEGNNNVKDFFATVSNANTLNAMTLESPSSSTSIFTVLLSTDGFQYSKPRIAASRYFIHYQQPRFHSFSPMGGPLCGGTVVTIVADYFVTGHIRAKFGDKVVSCSFRSKWSIKCVSPRSPTAGSVNLSISIDNNNVLSREFIAAPHKFHYFENTKYMINIANVFPLASPRMHSQKNIVVEGAGMISHQKTKATLLFSTLEIPSSPAIESRSILVALACRHHRI